MTRHESLITQVCSSNLLADSWTRLEMRVSNVWTGLKKKARNTYHTFEGRQTKFRCLIPRVNKLFIRKILQKLLRHKLRACIASAKVTPIQTKAIAHCTNLNKLLLTNKETAGSMF